MGNRLRVEGEARPRPQLEAGWSGYNFHLMTKMPSSEMGGTRNHKELALQPRGRGAVWEAKTERCVMLQEFG